MTMTTKKPLRTALEVYRSGYRNRHVLGGYVLASRSFFVELREAICYELEHYGFCSLVDELLKEPPAYMDKVAYAVFCDGGRLSFRPAGGYGAWNVQRLCALPGIPFELV